MSEHTEQAALFQWAQTQETNIPELRMLYAVPNGGHRHKAVAAKLKAEGVKAGVLDVNFDVARGIYHGLRIEIKIKGGRVRDSQKQWLKWYSEQGYCAVVCWSWVEAMELILDYLVLKPGQDWAGVDRR